MGRAEQQVDASRDRFVASKGYQAIRNPSARPITWSSGPVEVGYVHAKGTLVSTPGTALTPAVYQPGVVETMFQPLAVPDLFAQQTTTGPVVRYVVEGTATSVAAGVAKGGEKPESTLDFSEASEPVRKIATLLLVSDELLEDAPAIQQYLNSRLGLFVKIEEERQILHGSGGDEPEGVIGRGGVNTWGRGTADDNATAVFKAANGVRGSAFLDPDAVVINPANWQAIRLGRDTAGQFYGGGPFYGPYGGPQGPAPASQFSAGGLWGMRTVVTSAIGAGTALVGSFSQGGAVFRRCGVTIEASNSHWTWFASNLTAIRAEERLAVALFRPSAFCVVSGLAS